MPPRSPRANVEASIEDHRRSVYQARGESGRASAPSVGLADEYRKAEQVDPDPVSRSLIGEANEQFQRLGMIRSPQAQRVVDPRNPIATPEQVRAMGARYAPVAVSEQTRRMARPTGASMGILSTQTRGAGPHATGTMYGGGNRMTPAAAQAQMAAKESGVLDGMAGGTTKAPAADVQRYREQNAAGQAREAKQAPQIAASNQQRARERSGMSAPAAEPRLTPHQQAAQQREAYEQQRRELELKNTESLIASRAPQADPGSVTDRDKLVVRDARSQQARHQSEISRLREAMRNDPNRRSEIEGQIRDIEGRIADEQKRIDSVLNPEDAQRFSSQPPQSPQGPGGTYAGVGTDLYGPPADGAGGPPAAPSATPAAAGVSPPPRPAAPAGAVEAGWDPVAGRWLFRDQYGQVIQ